MGAGASPEAATGRILGDPSPRLDQSLAAPLNRPPRRHPVAKPYKRVVLKVSGESFAQEGHLGISPEELGVIAGEIAQARRLCPDLQLAVVVGGGNIVRGARLAETGRIAQSTADYMGMLGTVINGLALREALEGVGVPS
ncbi:MAG: hypothetical protein EBQ99_10190, partial [Planctomycetes bacterium]|nr:hypothetical protein [Planctomycetota bacterium]